MLLKINAHRIVYLLLKNGVLPFFWVILVALVQPIFAQEQTAKWIRPHDTKDVALWGIKDGIVFSLWPYGIETERNVYGGGPRGLIRVGFERNGEFQLLNFLAIEPVVKGNIEFSEISPSKVDGVWGKLMWASDHQQASSFYPTANSRGVITHPDPAKPKVEELAVYIFIEKFLSGAHPYLKLSIRSDRPEEIGITIFNREDSETMDFCNITATMGNYSRLRELHLRDRIIDSRTLYKDYKGIDFIEKAPYPADELLRSKQGDYFAFATTNESIDELVKWPDDSLAQAKQNWKYRPSLKMTQYWRKEASTEASKLHVRVNGRFRYWSGGSRDPKNYLAIPGGAAFENFELREPYYAGQTMFFGISTKSPQEILKQFNKVMNKHDVTK